MLTDVFMQAFSLIVSLDTSVMAILRLTLFMTSIAVTIATVLGVSVGVLLAIYRFPGRDSLVVMFTALMGLPPVVVGLFIYILLSRAGWFGVLGLLYTPAAMIIAQVVLITPIVISLTCNLMIVMWQEYAEHVRSFGLTKLQQIKLLLQEGKPQLAMVILTAVGRSLAEVGAVLIVGGNIENYTRVMTTAISLETSKGDLALALSLGIILLVLSLLVSLTILFFHSAKKQIG